jgi:hypothetical protein
MTNVGLILTIEIASNSSPKQLIRKMWYIFHCLNYSEIVHVFNQKKYVGVDPLKIVA